MRFEIASLGSHLATSVVPNWKICHFGRVEVSRLAGAWLAGRASLKMLEPKDPIRPRWGAKNASVLVGPPKKSFVGYVSKPFSKHMWRPEMR